MVEGIVLALAIADKLASDVGSREGQRPSEGVHCQHGQHCPILNSESLVDLVQMYFDGTLGYLQLPPDLLVR